VIKAFDGIDIERIDQKIVVMFNRIDEFPDYQDLDEDIRQRLRERLTEDDFALGLLTLQEVTYERSEAVPEHVDLPSGDAESVGDQLFAGAEYINSALQLYVRSEIDRVLEDERSDDDAGSPREEAAGDA